MDADAIATIRRTAHRALDYALSRATLAPGDTFTATLPLDPAQLAGGSARAILAVIAEVGHERGFAVGHTSGSSVITMTRTNWPDSGAVPTASLTTWTLDDLYELHQDTFDLLALLVRAQQSDRSEIYTMLALLVALLDLIRGFSE